MGINLASAIGEQRRPVNYLGGIAGGIDKIGDTIQDANQRKQKIEDDKDAAFNKGLSALTVLDINAHPEDEKRFKETAQKLTEEHKKLYLSGATKAELMQHEIDSLVKLKEDKDFYEQDFASLGNYFKEKEKDENLGTKIWEESDDFLAGNTYVNEDVPVAYRSREGGEVPTENKVVKQQGKGYFDLTKEERKKLYPTGLNTVLGEKIKTKAGNLNDALKGHLGKDYNPEKLYVEKVTIERPNRTRYQTITVDDKRIKADKEDFLNTRMNPNVDKKVSLYWRTLYNMVGEDARKKNLQGEEAKNYIESTVVDLASKDFDRQTQAEVEKVKKTMEDNSEGGKFELNFTSGGGGISSAGGVTLAKVDELHPREKRAFNERVNQLEEQKASLPAYAPNYEEQKAAIDAKIEQEKANLNSKQTGYYLLSNKERANDSFIEFRDTNDNDKAIQFQTKAIEEEGGKRYLIGTAILNRYKNEMSDADRKKYGDYETENVKVDDYKIELNNKNYKSLLTENPKGADLLEQFKPINYTQTEVKTSEKAAPNKESKGKQYKLSELTVDFINGLNEGEVIIVDGVKRVKQGGKLKKVKQ